MGVCRTAKIGIRTLLGARFREAAQVLFKSGGFRACPPPGQSAAPCPRRGWPLQPPVDDSAQIPPRSHSVVGVTARADETPVLVGLLAPLCFALFHFRMRPCAPSCFRLGLGTIAQKRSVIYCPHAFNPRRLRCAIFTGPPLGRRPAGRLAPARCLVPAGAKRNAIERDGAEDRFLRHRFRLADNAHSRVDNAYGEILPTAPAARPHDGSGNGGRPPAGRTQRRSLAGPVGLRDRPLRLSDRRLPLKPAVCV